jgi:Ca2+-transporting ATPase
LSGLLQEWADAIAILAIVWLNALLGFAQEYKAERALAALKRLSVTTARVVRGGMTQIVPARDLVPGDLIQVEAGDHVPADARLIYAASLRSQEAALTGESTPVEKHAKAAPSPEAALADRPNMLFFGTDVAAGKGQALVVATGRQTELGRIAALIGTATREPTPLQRRLAELSHALLIGVLAVVLVVFVLGVWRGEPRVTMFLTAVSLAVAAIPEGLPAIVTIALALGVTRMAARHALVRRLPAVETLGAATVICTDKTGTLTKNEMTVVRLLVDGCPFAVTGEGYEPAGEIKKDLGRGKKGEPAGDNRMVRELLTAAALCNDAAIEQDERGWRVVGDPTEGALLVAAAKAAIQKEPLAAAQPVLGEIPFDAERKLMTVVRRAGDGAMAYVKGAPDVLLRCCSRYLMESGETAPLTDEVRRAVLAANDVFAADALRVLGIARRQLDRAPDRYRSEELERDLVLIGLAAMQDPLRPEAIDAVRRCREAGVRTVMITGDHQETAAAVARRLGLLEREGLVVPGASLDGLSDAELAGRVQQVSVFARVSAEHKLRIVRAWKSHGAVVAMTGDGVNDAPAVKEADIGVAMGLTGTDVAKEAADVVVTDDNFASIAAAVEEGRGIDANIRKAIHYLLACNVSEVLVMVVATLAGLPLPLLPAQILWINLVTDGLPALALTVDPADPDLMRRAPRGSDVRILNRRRLAGLFTQGLFMAAVALLAFVYCLYGMDQDVTRARTIAFTVMVVIQLFFSLSCRSDRYTLARLGLWTNKPLMIAVVGSALLQAAILLHPATRHLFKTSPLDPIHWLLAFGLGLLPLLALEGWKAARARSA